MNLTTKKIISMFLAIIMILGMAPVSVFATETNPTVEIISFMRGEQSDLRSSELLEARVEGYDGNVRELTYKWSTTLGTYLYVYNSHNMYHIRNTPGEVEVYNSKKLLPTPDMVGRYYANEFSSVGFAWAAVHSNSIYDKNQLVGTVTVEVYDKDNNLLCSDSHEGKLVDGVNTGFLNYDLKEDLDDVVIGLFEGDKRNVKDLLGESSVVHIVCIASTVMAGAIRNGDEYIDLTKEADGDYYITADKAGTSTGSDGDALVDLTVQKTSCKFHRGSYESATTTVFVFKKPTTSTTTTTLTLDNLDDRCDYFINGVQGTEIDEDGDGKRDKVIFENLTPNTDYMVEVRGEYQVSDEITRYAYAFVYDTTKPVYKATVKTYLDGELTDISAIHGENVNLYLHEDKENADYIELTKSDIGTYTAAVENGIYYPWHIEAGDHYHQAREYKLIIENANGELSLHHYSVKYDTNGGTFKLGEEVATEVYSSMADVNVTENIPVREGFIFAGWEYNSKTYAPGTEVTSAISSPITLKAKWEKAVNVTINVTIDHQADGGYDHNETREELTVEFLEKTVNYPAFVETGDKLNFSEDGVTDEKGDAKPYVYSLEGEHLSKYTATDYTYTGLIGSSTFGVAVSKSGYDVGSIEKYQDKSGNWIINIPLTYNPDDFELEFSVEMDKSVPVELYPDAVIVKIACWDADANEWVIISQQRTTETVVNPGVRVDIDKATGEGYGSYPVWKHDAEGNLYGYRAVVTGFIYNNSTIIVPTEKDHTKEDGLVIVTYTDGNYTATMGDIDDGKKYSTSLNGAYYNDSENKQQGTLDGVITVEKYNVTFDAQGGTVNSKDTDIAENQYYVPDFGAYVPTMENHNFLGWYLDEECTVPATEGELLTEDITLYAKWDKVLTGTVIVDGYYDSTDVVDNDDRATHALVELEEITPDGTYNIAGQTVEIQWNAENHFSEPVSYEFKGLDPDKTYRVDVYLINYKAEYQNSTTVINGNGDIHDDYNENDYTAVYPEESKLETFVNIFLHFEPEEYIQNVEIDATRIGEGFRPSNALVKYYGQEIGAENDYELIVQHKGENDGVQVGMNAATGTNDGEYGEKVWKKNFNGNLYNYQADLTMLDGKEVADWPISVVYGDPARWSPYNQASTGPLKVTLVPRRYEITYNWNDGTDYKEIDSYAHTWSHDTEITYVPSRDGYTFDGWFDVNGNKVTRIDASVHADTELYAKWIPNAYAYTVNYLEEGTNNVLASAKTASADFGTTVTETAIAIEGYIVSGESSKVITIATEGNVINFYYTAVAEPDVPVDPDIPTDPDTPDTPADPDTPDVPGTPEIPEGDGTGSGSEVKNYILFGKTDGIGWYNVSKDGGKTYDIVFGNSTYEVKQGTQIIVKVGDLMGDNFVFYVNGEKYQSDENGRLVITVNGYMLIGAVSVVPEIDFEVPDVEESLNWFQKIIKAIKDFFAWLFGKK